MKSSQQRRWPGLRLSSRAVYITALLILQGLDLRQSITFTYLMYVFVNVSGKRLSLYYSYITVT